MGQHVPNGLQPFRDDKAIGDKRCFCGIHYAPGSFWHNPTSYSIWKITCQMPLGPINKINLNEILVLLFTPVGSKNYRVGLCILKPQKCYTVLCVTTVGLWRKDFLSKIHHSSVCPSKTWMAVGTLHSLPLSTLSISQMSPCTPLLHIFFRIKAKKI